METLLPSLVTAALTHFNESGLPVEAHFFHMALFQNIQGRPADVLNILVVITKSSTKQVKSLFYI